MQLDRRSFVKAAGLASLFGPMARAQARNPERPVFQNGALGRNPVARSFIEVPQSIVLPPVDVLGPTGNLRLDKLRGQTRIVSLWAEWCIPCLEEAKDLSDLRAAYANARFDIVAILTAGRAGLGQAEAQAKLARVGAPRLPTWVEAGGGKRIGTALGIVDPPHISLPCNLLVDRHGRVRGRSIGNGVSTLRGASHTHWASAEGAEFVKALSEGALA